MPRKLVVFFVDLIALTSNVTQCKVFSSLQTCSIRSLPNFHIAVDLSVHFIELLTEPLWAVWGVKLRNVRFFFVVILDSCVVVRPILRLSKVIEVIVRIDIRLFVYLFNLIFQRLTKHKVWKPVLEVLKVLTLRSHYTSWPAKSTPSYSFLSFDFVFPHQISRDHCASSPETSSAMNHDRSFSHLDFSLTNFDEVNDS